MALEVVDLLVRDAAIPNPGVSGVAVRVYDSTGTTFITAGVTDTNGHVQFTLPGSASPTPTRYQLRTYKIGVTIPQPQYIDVYSPASGSPTGTNNFRIDATVFSAPQATDPMMCRVSGFVRDPSGRPRPGFDINFVHRFNPLVVGTSPSVLVLGERVTQRTNKDGYFQVDLYRNGCYRAIIESHENVGRNVFVPDAPSVDLSTLLFPRVYAVLFSPAPPWTVAVGSTLEVSVQVQLTSGYLIDGTALEDVTYSQPDGETSLSLQVLDDRLLLTGLHSGASTIYVKRIDTSLAYQPDTAIVGDGAVVTVV